MDELTFHAEKTTIAAANQSALFSFSAAKYSKAARNTPIKAAAQEIRRFNRYIIKLLSWSYPLDCGRRGRGIT